MNSRPLNAAFRYGRTGPLGSVSSGTNAQTHDLVGGRHIHLDSSGHGLGERHPLGLVSVSDPGWIKQQTDPPGSIQVVLEGSTHPEAVSHVPAELLLGLGDDDRQTGSETRQLGCGAMSRRRSRYLRACLKRDACKTEQCERKTSIQDMHLESPHPDMIGP